MIIDYVDYENYYDDKEYEYDPYLFNQYKRQLAQKRREEIMRMESTSDYRENVWFSAFRLKRPIRSLYQALRYVIPQRLTLKYNPRIHAWLWWNL